MSATYATPLRLELGASRRMGGWLLAGHGLAALMLPLTPLSLSITFLLAAVILASLAGYWRRHASRMAPACIRSLVWEADGLCRLHLRDGTRCRTTLYRQAFVQPWLVILHLRGPGRRQRHLVVLPDMLDTTSFRRLRVRLRMELEQTDAAH